MVLVTSQGPSLPAGLDFAVQEGYLPPNPLSSAYTLENYSNHKSGLLYEEDELLITARCVIWSRGGIFRKCYNFDTEKETVSHAVLTAFPSLGPLATKNTKSMKKNEVAGSKEAAIVVFLKTQAHVYFLFGSSHIVHLPFEVESAFAAPNGVVMQRKFKIDVTAASLKFPRSPQNSFVSSQPRSWSAASSLPSTFSVSISDIETPRNISLSHSLRKDLWDPPLINADKNWPRLFSLSDPLAEIGLIVMEPPDPGGFVDKRGLKISQLDVAEEILHVSHRDQFSPKGTLNPLVFALTWNRETSKYTVWKLSYVRENFNKNDSTKVTVKTSSVNTSRRRSSYVPPATGSTTPVIIGQQQFRDIIPGNQVVVSRKSLKLDQGRDNVEDFVSALDTEFPSQTTPRRKSRRVSSMLARADLSASHERSTFSDLAASHQFIPSRRVESSGSQNTRTSLGTLGASNSGGLSQSSLFRQSLNSFLETPGDEMLDDLRMRDDFEGFTSTGTEMGDFDALKQEIFLTKIGSVSAEYDNFRYSTQNKPAATQYKVFTMAAPPCAADEDRGNTNIICILHPIDKRLIIITLYTKLHTSDDISDQPKNDSQTEEIVASVSLGSTLKANHVIDACKIEDGSVSRILVLSETEDGFGELTLQAPWSTLMKVSLPTRFQTVNIRTLGVNLQNTIRKTLVRPSALRGLRNSRPGGRVDILDDEGNLHRIRLLLQPENPHVCKVLELCREILPVRQCADSDPPSHVDGFLVCWWNVIQWLERKSFNIPDLEWSALVITLFAAIIGMDQNSKTVQSYTGWERRSNVELPYSSSELTPEIELLELMQLEEAHRGNQLPSWAQNTSWTWLTDDSNSDLLTVNNKSASIFATRSGQGRLFARKHVNLAYEYLNTLVRQAKISECFPIWVNMTMEDRAMVIKNLFIGLHLLREEQKLDIMNSDCFSTGRVSLLPILAQIAVWLGWPSWVKCYETEEATFLISDMDTSKFCMSLTLLFLIPLDAPNQFIIPEPFECPSIYLWLQKCLCSQSLEPFMTISQFVGKSRISAQRSPCDGETKLTPRTLMLKQFFEVISCSDYSAPRVFETLFSAGADFLMFETLPEAILAPLQEAIISCRSEPPLTWNKELLSLIGREDVNISLTCGQKPWNIQPKILAPSHVSSTDVHTICMLTSEAETIGSFDGSVEFDRQSITKSIFRDDRRVNEAVLLLDTTHPTVARCKVQPNWSEYEILEAQKEHAQILAYRTLAIPAGRGLLFFSARIPLLTQKWHISGFNLSFIMKPDNITVAADKTAFTEEKVCWAFFHAGVAAGLQISREAKFIDTSWIIYNKPPPDHLNNRHAGFLFALGLNGHLKSLAKWVAFKYLTPKHTMTSIGLLLGLAASYIGTMDSLITRLLSVHVTRMLPPGAAELNLSPLTQTTGIMGIGLLYCNTQHRRMSEIMVSEIEHIDTETEEEPLRYEGYRLAAGFALGLINLGKGSDLKGLYDMRLTERLFTLASGSKKVDLVHILEKATAAAVIAIALIFMKSENQIIARKINVPDSLLQFDYVRPDIFLLRTVASHLIMWSKIEPSFKWIKDNLPEQYRYRSMLDSITSLTTEDLAFYDIIAGLCFSIALRFAGSASLIARDVLVHYLDQFMRICRIEASKYDEQLTRNTVRNCQDLLALSTATVMAGTGDLVVFRRLRSLHGRDDSKIPYGSHFVAHIAIGALFLGGGTFTFGTSNLAIAALLIAFYPIFPSTVHDNKAHLQAFRHFWALAAEPRCLIARDIDTNQPVTVPILITPRIGDQFLRYTPCLLPELDQIKALRTDAPDYWNLCLDFENNLTHISAFKSKQTIYIRRRPAHTFASTPFQATLQALNDAENTSSLPLEQILELDVFACLTKAEKALVLPRSYGSARDIYAGTSETAVDARLVLEKATLRSGKKDRLLGLKLLFEWADDAANRNQDIRWIRKEVVEKLKTMVWMMTLQD
ncbi:Negative regulator of mitosis [Podosphaera aphanis]|nr:Negative regulator of mitosis [Podosphaera aphanis]